MLHQCNVKCNILSENVANDVAAMQRNLTTGFAVDFRPTSDIFVSVKVTGLQTPTEFGASGGSALQNGSMARVSSHQLDYRFYVRPGVSLAPTRGR